MISSHPLRLHPALQINLILQLDFQRLSCRPFPLLPSSSLQAPHFSHPQNKIQKPLGFQTLPGWLPSELGCTKADLISAQAQLQLLAVRPQPHCSPRCSAVLVSTSRFWGCSTKITSCPTLYWNRRKLSVLWEPSYDVLQALTFQECSLIVVETFYCPISHGLDGVQQWVR